VRIAALLLAAGRSTRFGDADKLAASLDGKPLLDHAASALRSVSLPLAFAVRPAGGVPCHGFATVTVERPDAGLGHSLAVGTRAARLAGAEAVLIALGDMPFVPPSHLAALAVSARSPDILIASTADGKHPCPPALIGSHWFAELETLDADAGARALLARGRLVTLPPEMLRDIDTPADLQRARHPDRDLP
jgi:molybdenum cofactor cytidylyltransferase